MSRPDPIEYAERLYKAMRSANFSPISFLAFGNAVKDGVALRNLPRIAAEPFMRIVGEMLELEEQASAEDDIIDADTVNEGSRPDPPAEQTVPEAAEAVGQQPANTPKIDATAELATQSAPTSPERRRNGAKR